MSESTEAHGPLAEVGRYARLAEARERGLVVAARELPHWIEREGDAWVLCVEAGVREEAARELAAFEAEEQARPPRPKFLPMEKVPKLSLYLATWLMSGFFLIQQLAGERWTERGAAWNEAMLQRGEWWRAVTALTLHADLSHCAANLATGLLFAAFVLPRLGTGLTWLAVLWSGTLGNVINAWGYRGESHLSIGASTAVFGALGLLVGGEFIDRFRAPDTRNRWQLVLPIGAGLSLLAYLGVGDEQKNVDFMAHLWGFVAGLGGGALAAAFRLKARTSPTTQHLASFLTLALLALCWWLAWRS